MRRYAVVVAIVGLAALLVAGPALAFQCPKLQKDAAEAIAKAEAAAGKMADAKMKGAAQAMVNVAKELNKASEADHKKGADTKDANLHYRAEAEAKAAKALADMAGKM